jgi:hypothetical protein
MTHCNETLISLEFSNPPPLPYQRLNTHSAERPCINRTNESASYWDTLVADASLTIFCSLVLRIVQQFRYRQHNLIAQLHFVCMRNAGSTTYQALHPQQSLICSANEIATNSKGLEIVAVISSTAWWGLVGLFAMFKAWSYYLWVQEDRRRLEEGEFKDFEATRFGFTFRYLFRSVVSHIVLTGLLLAPMFI